jgi:hypothetical protein
MSRNNTIIFFCIFPSLCFSKLKCKLNWESVDGRQASAQQGRPSAVPMVTVGVFLSNKIWSGTTNHRPHRLTIGKGCCADSFTLGILFRNFQIYFRKKFKLCFFKKNSNIFCADGFTVGIAL